MANPTYISMSVQSALRRQMDLIAHNMANIGTTSFKSEKPIFVQVLDEAGEIAYVEDFGVTRDMRPGHLQTTGNPLDLAIEGDAFLVVDVDGESRYTRNGHLSLNDERELVTSTGYPVLDVDDRTIEIPPNAHDLTIGEDGTISSEAGPIGRLSMVWFENVALLQRSADSLFITDQDEIEPRDASLLQGSLEASNVRPVMELTSMINVLRAYQQNAQLVEGDHEMQMDTINTIIQA